MALFFTLQVEEMKGAEVLRGSDPGGGPPPGTDDERSQGSPLIENKTI